MVYRAQESGIINESTSKWLWMEFARRGWRTQEPGHVRPDRATRFEQLKAYKDRFGDCRVPAKWKENPQLGMWATHQRQHRKNGKLSPEKGQLLREIGFE